MDVCVAMDRVSRVSVRFGAREVCRNRKSRIVWPFSADLFWLPRAILCFLMPPYYSNASLQHTDAPHDESSGGPDNSSHSGNEDIELCSFVKWVTIMEAYSSHEPNGRIFTVSSIYRVSLLQGVSSISH